MMDRVAVWIADQFRTESRVAKRRCQVRVDVQRRVRRDYHALLLSVVRNAQRFGEARRTRESNCT